MFNITIVPKGTRYKGFSTVLQTVETEHEAAQFCEMWGWSYDDGHKSYWLDYEEKEEEIIAI